MAKKHRKAPRTRSRTSPPGRLDQGLKEVARLIGRRQWKEARDLLESLDKRFPGRPEFLNDLADVYLALGDMKGYQGAAERLVQADPDDAENTLALAGVYLTNERPAMALRSLREFVKRWPRHSEATRARKTVADLDAMMTEIYAELGVADRSIGETITLLHEKVQSHLAANEYQQTRETAEELLELKPDFSAARSNLSLAFWLEGYTDRAIEQAEQVLTFEPDNVHALSNLVRFLHLGGRTEEAKVYADRMRASTALAADKLLKQMEAFAFLGDDDAVLALYETGDEVDQEHPMVHHLAAVAMLRLGREQEGRHAWQRALEIQPDFGLARENLNDLREPAGQRHAPWPFPWTSWVCPEDVKSLVNLLTRGDYTDDARFQRDLRRLLKARPGITSRLPFLLQQGDPAGREMAVRLIRAGGTPELLEALKEFALSQHGPDEMRLSAAHFLADKGVLDAGLVHLFREGKQQELMLRGFEIGDESEDFDPLPPRLALLAEESTLALLDDDHETAERLIREGLALRPDTPTLLNNLALIYQIQGRGEEAIEITREINQRHPNYLFARVSLARLSIHDGELERARDELLPLLQRKKLHFTEFCALSAAFIELHLAEGQQDAARMWLDMWESVDPKDPQLINFRRLVARRSKRKRGRGSGRGQ